MKIAPPNVEEPETVWTWSESPLNGGKHGTGIEQIEDHKAEVAIKLFDTVKEAGFDGYHGWCKKELALPILDKP